LDGEIAQLAALTISANHRIANPDDPMPWFANQRAFASCREISFHAAPKRRLLGGPKPVEVAANPGEWLDRLTAPGVNRVLMAFDRLDLVPDPEETVPDRVAAAFAGGGSAWSMYTVTPDGGALQWRAEWRAAFPDDPDRRIWAARYHGRAAAFPPVGTGVADASEDLHEACEAIRAFAEEHCYEKVASIFASALSLLDGRPDPILLERPPGPADTLPEGARRLLFASQRSWIFDRLSLWKDEDFSAQLWRRYAGLSETLYDAVTAGMKAAVNASASLEDNAA
jgi:hypothetical protein